MKNTNDIYKQFIVKLITGTKNLQYQWCRISDIFPNNENDFDCYNDEYINYDWTRIGNLEYILFNSAGGLVKTHWEKSYLSRVQNFTVAVIDEDYKDAPPIERNYTYGTHIVTLYIIPTIYSGPGPYALEIDRELILELLNEIQNLQNNPNKVIDTLIFNFIKD